MGADARSVSGADRELVYSIIGTPADQAEIPQSIGCAVIILILVFTSDEIRQYSEGYIGNAFNIDHRNIDERRAEIAGFKNKPVIVYCYSGMRAGLVEAKLIKHGFSHVQHLEGDWSAWKDAGLVATIPE